MREIKIRVFNTEIKEMIYFHPLALTEDGCSIAAHQTSTDQHDWIDTWINSLDGKCIFMEYTGLKDNNGNDIYDGDIVRVSEYLYKAFREVGWIKTNELPYYLISYSEEFFSYFKHDLNVIKNLVGQRITNPETLEEKEIDLEKAKWMEHGSHLWLIKGDKELEIVGNIHANPELLKP